jgi:hypothetical protein
LFAKQVSTNVDVSKLLAATADTAKGESLQNNLAEIVTTIW